MKKVLSFIVAIMCLSALFCGTCFATGGDKNDLNDPMADAKAKFAGLSQEEKDELYKLSDKVVEDISKLLNEYAKCGVIDSKTYETIITSLNDRVAAVKEEGEFPGFLPPPPPPPVPKS